MPHKSDLRSACRAAADEPSADSCGGPTGAGPEFPSRRDVQSRARNREQAYSFEKVQTVHHTRQVRAAARVRGGRSGSICPPLPQGAKSHEGSTCKSTLRDTSCPWWFMISLFWKTYVRSRRPKMAPPKAPPRLASKIESRKANMLATSSAMKQPSGVFS